MNEQPQEFPRSVREVIILGEDGPVVVHERQRKRKKSTRELRPLRRLVRGLAQAQAASSDEYLRRLDRSDEKKKDGWVRDHVWNTLRAGREGQKKLRKIRLF
jgi:hypothetical protein